MFSMDTYIALRNAHLKAVRENSYSGNIRRTLKAVIRYLDAHGMTMPKPKWYYRQDDITTWGYIENGKMNKRFENVCFDINPLFQYGHLL